MFLGQGWNLCHSSDNGWILNWLSHQGTPAIFQMPSSHMGLVATVRDSAGQRTAILIAVLSAFFASHTVGALVICVNWTEK